MRISTVSVPGKIHLMGEHAVVYGKPALLAAINKRLSVTISESTHTDIQVADASAVEFIQHAISLVRKEYSLPDEPYSLTLKSDIPFGYHLGSSAALAVAVVASYIHVFKKLWNPTEINRIAYEVEKKQHGTPSGGDNTAIVYGGFLWYRKELEFLKSLWQLPIKLPNRLNHLYLINTGKPKETTGEMVAGVKEAYQMNRKDMEEAFIRNEECTKDIATAIKKADEELFIQAMREGEKTLETMGVVSKKVSPCIRAIEKAGGAAKILGGGGKQDAVGFVLAYHHDKKILETIVQTYGWDIEPVVLGEEGVRLVV